MTPDDEIILAKTLWGEARGESFLGQAAVCWVILNRAKHENKTIREICLAPLQFSTWNGQHPTLDELPLHQLTQQWDVIHHVLSGKTTDPTHNARWYVNVNINPYWTRGKTPCVVIGNHKFYNNIEETEATV